MQYVKDIEQLIEKYETGDEGSEYIDQMPPSVEKTLQLLLTDVTRGCTYRECLVEMLEPRIPANIRAERFKIEMAVANLLVRSKSHFRLDDVQQVIFDEEGPDGFHNIFMMFDSGKGKVDIGEIMEVVNDAWNYFPHRLLNGKSPAEMMAQQKVVSPIQPSDLG